MVKEAISFREGCWLMLFDDNSALAHTEKLGNEVGREVAGFGDIGIILRTALEHECPGY